MNSWTKMNVLLNVYISNTDRKRNMYKIGWTNQTKHGIKAWRQTRKLWWLAWCIINNLARWPFIHRQIWLLTWDRRKWNYAGKKKHPTVCAEKASLYEVSVWTEILKKWNYSYTRFICAEYISDEKHYSFDYFGVNEKKKLFVCQTAATLRLDMKVLRLRLQLPEPQIRLVNKNCCTSLQASFYIPGCQQERRSVRKTGWKQHLSVHFLQLLPSSYLKKTLSWHTAQD